MAGRGSCDGWAGKNPCVCAREREWERDSAKQTRVDFTYNTIYLSLAALRRRRPDPRARPAPRPHTRADCPSRIFRVSLDIRTASGVSWRLFRRALLGGSFGRLFFPGGFVGQLLCAAFGGQPAALPAPRARAARPPQVAPQRRPPAAAAPPESSKTPQHDARPRAPGSSVALSCPLRVRAVPRGATAAPPPAAPTGAVRVE